MKDHDPRACAGTAFVTLLAIAGFVCIVALPAADLQGRWPQLEARGDIESTALLSPGESP